MAQHVRVHVDVEPRRRGAQRLMRLCTSRGDRRLPERPTKSAASPGCASFARTGEPARERRERRRADGNDARLRSLAEDARLARRAIDGVDVEPGELRDPQPAGIGELEERAVANAERRESSTCATSRTASSGERALGSAWRARGGAHAGCRDWRQLAVAREPVEEAAPAREHARERARREALAVQRGDEAADVVRASRSSARARRRARRASRRRARTRRACGRRAGARCEGGRGSAERR